MLLISVQPEKERVWFEWVSSGFHEYQIWSLWRNVFLKISCRHILFWCKEVAELRISRVSQQINRKGFYPFFGLWKYNSRLRILVSYPDDRQGQSESKIERLYSAIWDKLFFTLGWPWVASEWLHVRNSFGSKVKNPTDSQWGLKILVWTPLVLILSSFRSKNSLMCKTSRWNTLTMKTSW